MGGEKYSGSETQGCELYPAAHRTSVCVAIWYIGSIPSGFLIDFHLYSRFSCHSCLLLLHRPLPFYSWSPPSYALTLRTKVDNLPVYRRLTLAEVSDPSPFSYFYRKSTCFLLAWSDSSSLEKTFGQNNFRILRMHRLTKVWISCRFILWSSTFRICTTALRLHSCWICSQGKLTASPKGM